MKTFNYERAADFQDAGQLKTKYKNAEFIAGGTDLLGKLKKEILPEQPETLIDLKSIADARGIKVENGVMDLRDPRRSFLRRLSRTLRRPHTASSDDRRLRSGTHRYGIRLYRNHKRHYQLRAADRPCLYVRHQL